jgi:hypothetical protein
MSGKTCQIWCKSTHETCVRMPSLDIPSMCFSLVKETRVDTSSKHELGLTPHQDILLTNASSPPNTNNSDLHTVRSCEEVSSQQFPGGGSGHTRSVDNRPMENGNS